MKRYRGGRSSCHPWRWGQGEEVRMMRTEELRKGSQGRAGNQVSEEESALMRLVPRALEKLQSVISCGCQDGGLFLGRCWRGQRNVEGASLSPSWGFPLALLWVEANGGPPRPARQRRGVAAGPQPQHHKAQHRS